MKYYSTNRQAPVATLEEAVVKGLAADKGLFMPEAIKSLPQEFYGSIEQLSFQEIAYHVADATIKLLRQRFDCFGHEKSLIGITAKCRRGYWCKR